MIDIWFIFLIWIAPNAVIAIEAATTGFEDDVPITTH